VSAREAAARSAHGITGSGISCSIHAMAELWRGVHEYRTVGVEMFAGDSRAEPIQRLRALAELRIHFRKIEVRWDDRPAA